MFAVPSVLPLRARRERPRGGSEGPGPRGAGYPPRRERGFGTNVGARWWLLGVTDSVRGDLHQGPTRCLGGRSLA